MGGKVRREIRQKKGGTAVGHNNKRVIGQCISNMYTFVYIIKRERKNCINNLLEDC